MNNALTGAHSIEMIARNELRVSGVSDVHSFNEEGVLLETSNGLLTVGGSDLRITKLNLEQGEVALCGDITMLVYNDDAKPGQKGSGGLFMKLFK